MIDIPRLESTLEPINNAEAPALFAWIAPPMGEGDAADGRAAEWSSSLKPWDVFDVFLLGRAAAESLRVERFEHHDRVLRHMQSARASLRWNTDRQLDAEALGAGIARAPALVARQLAATPRGCDWLIARWEILGRALDHKGSWDQAQDRRALDLLGTPAESRDDDADAPAPGLDLDLEGRRALVLTEVGKLRAAKVAGLSEFDALERSAAVAGFGPDGKGELAATRRYERAAARRLEWNLDALRRRRNGHRPDARSPVPPPWTPPSPAPPHPPAPREPLTSEDEWRETTRALDEARKRAQPAPEPEPTPEPTPVPEPVPVPVVEPTEAEQVAAMTPERRRELIRNHPEFQALSKRDKIRTLIHGEVPAKPQGNRRSRRARKAIDRRRG